MVAEQRRPAVRCPTDGLPSEADVTEGFRVGNGADNALNMAAAAEGIPNNTGLLQVADIKINDIFKIKWV